jgi:hypothetical protein
MYQIYTFVASALYYLAELVEEYTVITGKIIRISIGVSKNMERIIGLHCSLLS